MVDGIGMNFMQAVLDRDQKFNEKFCDMETLAIVGWTRHRNYTIVFDKGPMLYLPDLTTDVMYTVRPVLEARVNKRTLRRVAFVGFSEMTLPSGVTKSTLVLLSRTRTVRRRLVITTMMTTHP